MLKFDKTKTFSILLFILLLVLVPVLSTFTFVPKVYAATSPSLNALSNYSVLGGQAVTCTASATTTGAVGVSSGTSITGFSPSCTAGGGTQSNNASAIAAQAENLATFTALDQTCDQTFGAVDLTATFPSGVGPGVYCSTSSFTLSGNLNLTGSGVWIFKTASTLITASGSSVTGGDPCNVWWRVGSSATLGSTTSFIGNILALNGVTALNSGATLNGRVLAQDAGTVTLNGNTISGPTCSASSAGSSASSAGSSTTNAPSACPAKDITALPRVIESKRISPTSIFIKWGPYEGVNDFVIQYGYDNVNWPYNTRVTGFETTIRDLPANRPIWVRVAATDNCSVGSYSSGTLVGNPGFPNTGFGSLDIFSDILNGLRQWLYSFVR